MARAIENPAGHSMLDKRSALNILNIDAIINFVFLFSVIHMLLRYNALNMYINIPPPDRIAKIDRTLSSILNEQRRRSKTTRSNGGLTVDARSSRGAADDT